MLLHKFRPPQMEFVPVQYQWAGAGSPRRCFVGSTACLVGWIPYFSKKTQLPEGFLRERFTNDRGLRLLMGSGNHPPANGFPNGREDLLRYLELQDFRGAVAIDAPTLFVDMAGDPVGLEFSSVARVGTTPMRGKQLTAALKGFVWLSGGVSEAFGEIHQDGKRVWIRVFLRLKLGLPGQIAAKAMTSYWPPWATLTVEYAFDLDDHEANISFMGTAVPSQHRYVGWNVDSVYDIVDGMSEAAYDGFVEAGGCQDALAVGTSVKSELQRVEFAAE